MTCPETWVRDHGDALYRYALSRVRRAEVAEDLVQEAILAGLKNRHSFDQRSTVKTWLIGILRHKILDHFRGQARDVQEEGLDRWADGAFSRIGKWKQAPAKWNAAMVDPEQDELRAVLNQCLGRLPGRHAETLLLAERDQRKAEGIAEHLDTSVGNVHVLLHRARLALRECLERNWFKSDVGRSC